MVRSPEVILRVTFIIGQIVSDQLDRLEITAISAKKRMRLAGEENARSFTCQELN